MSDGIYVALSGAVAHQVNLENIATNLANINTAGYMKSKAVFREVLSKAEGREPLRFGAVAATMVDTTAGAKRVTGNDMDIALAPGQYLSLQTEAGERYTRAGALKIDTEGFLTSGGHPVLSEGGSPVQISNPEAVQTLQMNEDGSFLVDGQVFEKVKIVQFEDQSALVHEGGVLLRANDGAGVTDAPEAQIQVGAVEESNASAVTLMNELITGTRLFDAFQRAIDSFRDADRKAATTVAMVRR